MNRKTAAALAASLALSGAPPLAAPPAVPPDASLPSLAEVLAARTDLWAEAALRQPGGASYEFFARLLPPPRYVNADFRHYPLVLSAPGSAMKARLVSNGSALNARGGSRSWNDVGTPLTFRVGPDELRFGEYPERVDGPRYAEGWLPIAQVNYTHGEAVYAEEGFASVEPALAEHGVVLVKLSLASGTNGSVAVQMDLPSPPQAGQEMLRDDRGRVLVWLDAHWKWTRQRLVAALSPNKAATLAIATKPLAGDAPSPLAAGGYDRQRRRCVEAWRQLVTRGMAVEVPEPIVQHAWRALVAANFALTHSNRIHYSAGNQYDRLYEAEGSDAALALLDWGFTNEVRRLIVPLLDFTRRGLEFHQAGHKLQTLARYFQLTHDAEFLREMRPRWEKEVARIVAGRTNEHGLFPREQYCGDIATPVFSLNSNAKCWRALRDFAAVLAELGERDEARRLADTAAGFRQQILAAVAASERRDVQPPFIPIALLGEEQPYDPITGTKMGSYWNLMANYVLGSGVFGPGSERERWLLDYLQQRGGLCLGLTRSRPNPTFWTGPHSINPLYGQRYVLTLLQRDEPDRALVSFYGMLAQGFTRDTFMAGEGCSLTPLDDRGRLFYCPPNSAANGFFLEMLRHLLVQDWDLDDDGRPETLRLCFATPRRWLAAGQVIKVERAPTAFGPVSVRMESRLNNGEIVAEVEGPPRPPKALLLRARVPEGWRAVAARAGELTVNADAQGTVDLSPLKGRFTARFVVARQP
jgi:hypothetical protein